MLLFLYLFIAVFICCMKLCLILWLADRYGKKRRGREVWAQRNAAMAKRCQVQHDAWMEGMPYGTYGEWMPPLEFIPEWMIENQPSLRSEEPVVEERVSEMAQKVNEMSFAMACVDDDQEQVVIRIFDEDDDSPVARTYRKIDEIIKVL